MDKLFDLDSPVMRFLNRVADLLILNFLMIACCLPIITAGAAFTAMHYVLLKIVRNEEGYLIRGFFRSFAANFKQATILWLIMLLVTMVYIGDTLIFRYSTLHFPRAVTIAVAVIAVLCLMTAVYVFPLQARFENSIKNTLKNAMLIAFANLPKTITMMVFYALPLIILRFSAYSLVFLIMFGISVPAYGAAWLYSGIFKKLEPEAKEVSDLDFSLNMDERNGEIDE